MPRYKTLRSIAHNTGHSFVSSMHYFDDDYGIEHVRRAAKAAQADEVQIDLLFQRIQPPAMATSGVRKAASHAHGILKRLLGDEGWPIESMRSALLEVGLPDSYCQVTLVDDRGTSHVGNVKQWGA